MNIYEFINSKDIAEHCKRIGHKFSAMEHAYFVWRSNHHTLEEKHKAWQEILDTMPNEPFPDDIFEPLHTLLKLHMKTQNAYLRRFKKNTGQHIYFFELLRDTGYDCNGVLYENYDACIESLKAIVKKSDDIIKVKVVKRRLHSTKTRSSYLDVDEAIILGTDLSVIDINPSEHDYDADDERFYLDAEPIFQDIPVAIPSPFKSGDIVIDASKTQDSKPRPFVVDGFTVDYHRERSGGEETMYRLMDGWFFEDDRYFRKSLGVDYLDMEYYRCELNGYENFLSDFSKHLKGEMGIGDLLWRFYFALKNPETLHWLHSCRRDNANELEIHQEAT